MRTASVDVFPDARSHCWRLPRLRASRGSAPRSPHESGLPINSRSPPVAPAPGTVTEERFSSPAGSVLAAIAPSALCGLAPRSPHSPAPPVILPSPPVAFVPGPVADEESSSSAGSVTATTAPAALRGLELQLPPSPGPASIFLPPAVAPVLCAVASSAWSHPLRGRR
jgi:hypothetical protein